MSETLMGRRDWDYVDMSDYQADMRESADSAAAAIAFVKGREREAKLRYSFLELALADALRQLGPGASAKVTEGAVQRLPDDAPTLIFERFDYDRTERIRLGRPKT
jgi:hypothetical protein